MDTKQGARIHPAEERQPGQSYSVAGREQSERDTRRTQISWSEPRRPSLLCRTARHAMRCCAQAHGIEMDTAKPQAVPVVVKLPSE
jgi:hypothetical protein